MATWTKRAGPLSAAFTPIADLSFSGLADGIYAIEAAAGAFEYDNVTARYERAMVECAFGSAVDMSSGFAGPHIGVFALPKTETGNFPSPGPGSLNSDPFIQETQCGVLSFRELTGMQYPSALYFDLEPKAYVFGFYNGLSNAQAIPASSSIRMYFYNWVWEDT